MNDVLIGETPISVPAPDVVAAAQLTAFMAHVARKTGRAFPSYAAFERFAVAELRLFWRLLAEWAHLPLEGALEPVCLGDECKTARFFPRLSLNYAEALIGDPYLGDRMALTALAAGGRRERLTRAVLRDRVLRLAAALRGLGVRRGDRVGAVMRNGSEAVVAALASAAVGATFASCAPDMGNEAILNRFRPLDPVLLFAHAASAPRDVGEPLSARIAEIADGLPGLVALVVLDDGAVRLDAATVYRLGDLLARSAPLAAWERFAFDHPLFAMFSSGTTGPPKSILHGAGGTLLEHVKEHRLHCDLRAGDKLFFQTSCGWMMWQWQLSALASGAEIVLHDGPLDGPETFWRIVAEERVTQFGTNPAYLQLCQDRGFAPAAHLDLAALRAVLSTGSILYDAQYDWARAHVGAHVPLQSISGGTDIIGCFVLGNPILPVYRGEAQCRSLALDVRALPPADEPEAPVGELVCANPFPSRPIGFFGDPEGSRFHEAYFSQNPGLWTHGDLIGLTRSGGARMHGRSDGVLNIRGIRIGPAEIYRILRDVPEIADALAVEQRAPREAGGVRLVLLVVLRGAAKLSAALVARLRRELQRRGSAAMVPAVVIELAELPLTHSGKKSEAAARDVINRGKLRNRAALRNPGCLDGIAGHPALAERPRRPPGGAGTAQERLRAIWEHYFGFAPIALDDNFFEIGGHSLLAMRILLELRETVGRDLPLSTMLYAPTIRQLARLVDCAEWTPFSTVVTLREGDRANPLFLVHGLGGNVLELVPLAAALHTRRAVLALQARGLDAAQAPHDRIEAMAVDYIAEIRRIQPAGPYAIAGFSFGGLVAFEMAQLLLARGEAVSFLGLIDTDVHEGALPLRAWLAFEAARLHRHWRELRRSARDGLADFLRARRDGIIDRLRIIRGQAPRRRWEDEEALAPVLLRVRDAARVAFAHYRPRPYPGRVALFRAAERLTWFCDPLPVWRCVAGGGLDEVEIAASHLGLVNQPGLGLLAAAVDRCLAEADASSPLASPADARMAFPPLHPA
jgi:acetoacetyl-CoA synthetase